MRPKFLTMSVEICFACSLLKDFALDPPITGEPEGVSPGVGAVSSVSPVTDAAISLVSLESCCWPLAF